MKKMSKGLLGMFATALLLSGCAQKGGDAVSLLRDGQTDSAYVQEKGTLVIGITEFAPMDYLEADRWVGFDAQLAEAFAQELGVTPEFQTIDWDKKTDLLEDGTIDCIWNGMTLTEDLQQEISCSDPYLSNAQVIVMKKDKMDQYSSAEQCQHMLFAVESGSTGEDILKEMKYRYTVYDTQKDALQSVCDNKTDAAVTDIIMAGYYTAEGNEFAQLGYQFPLNNEQICVGFRSGSDLTEKANAFFAAHLADGTMTGQAGQYGIEGAVLGTDGED